jgi:hypothetical protein
MGMVPISEDPTAHAQGAVHCMRQAMSERLHSEGKRALVVRLGNQVHVV